MSPCLRASTSADTTRPVYREIDILAYCCFSRLSIRKAFNRREERL
jgi:hypothetical protein